MKFIHLISIISFTLPCVKCELGTKFSKPRFKEAEDVGVGHTKVIQDIHQRMQDAPPLNGNDYLVHMINAVVDYVCVPMTRECVEGVLSTTNNMDMSYQNGFAHLSENILTSDFDKEVLNSVESLFFSLGLLDWDESPEEILNIMYKNFEDLRDNTKVQNEHHRLVGLVAYSVGMESAKQWHEIFNEPDNQFHRFIQNEKTRRNLQAQTLSNLLNSVGDNVDPTRLVEADVIGGASGAIVVGFDRFVRGQESEADVLSEALEKATSTAVIFSSTNVAVQSGVLNGGNNNNGTGIFGGLFGGGGNNGTGIFGGLFGGGGNNGTGIFGGGNNNNNNGTGIFGGLFGGGGNNGTGIFGGGNNNNNGTGIFAGLGGGNNNNNGTGFLGGLLGGGGNNNNNTQGGGGGGGGLFSGISNILGGGGGNNNEEANEVNVPEQVDEAGLGDVFNNTVGTLTGNDNVGVGTNLTTSNNGGIANQGTGTTSNPSAIQSTVEETSSGGGTGAISNLIGGIGGFLGGGNDGDNQNTDAEDATTEEGSGNAVAQGLGGLSNIATGIFGGRNNAANRQPNGN